MVEKLAAPAAYPGTVVRLLVSYVAGYVYDDGYRTTDASKKPADTQAADSVLPVCPKYVYGSDKGSTSPLTHPQLHTLLAASNHKNSGMEYEAIEC